MFLNWSTRSEIVVLERRHQALERLPVHAGEIGRGHVDRVLGPRLPGHACTANTDQILNRARGKFSRSSCELLVVPRLSVGGRYMGCQRQSLRGGVPLLHSKKRCVETVADTDRVNGSSQVGGSL